MIRSRKLGRDASPARGGVSIQYLCCEIILAEVVSRRRLHGNRERDLAAASSSIGHDVGRTRPNGKRVRSVARSRSVERLLRDALLNPSPSSRDVRAGWLQRRLEPCVERACRLLTARYAIPSSFTCSFTKSCSAPCRRSCRSQAAAASRRSAPRGERDHLAADFSNDARGSLATR